MKIIKCKGLVDVAKGKVLPNPIVMIQEDRIAAIEIQENMPLLPNQAECLDFSNNYILPGLINSHAHLVMPGDGTPIDTWVQHSNEMFLLTASKNARLALMSGVTTIRDCGGRDNIMFTLREAVEMGIVEGPRLFLSGRMLTNTGGHCHYFHGEVDSIDGMRKAVRGLFEEGADFIKIIATGGMPGTYPQYATFNVPEIVCAVEMAHRMGKKVAAHCIGIPGMENAIEAGIDHVEHASFMLPDMKLKFNPRLAETMAESGMYVAPTLQVGRDVIQALTQKIEVGAINEIEKKMLEDWTLRQDESYACFQGLLKFGVHCVAGNDAGWRFTRFDRFWQELDAMVEGGMTPMQAIIAATKTAAEAMGVYEEIGSLEVGKKADIIAVDEDPTLDISALSQVSFVMKDGSIHLLK